MPTLPVLLVISPRKHHARARKLTHACDSFFPRPRCRLDGVFSTLLLGQVHAKYFFFLVLERPPPPPPLSYLLQTKKTWTAAPPPQTRCAEPPGGRRDGGPRGSLRCARRGRDAGGSASRRASMAAPPGTGSRIVIWEFSGKGRDPERRGGAPALPHPATLRHARARKEAVTGRGKAATGNQPTQPCCRRGGVGRAAGRVSALHPALFTAQPLLFPWPLEGRGLPDGVLDGDPDEVSAGVRDGVRDGVPDGVPDGVA